MAQPTPHNDLVISYKIEEESKSRKLDKNFKESNVEKFKRLSREYDLLADNINSEKYLQNLLADEEDQSPEKWYEYAKFCLRYDQTQKAELFMNKYVQAVGCDTRLNLLMGALYLQDKQYSRAQQHLHQVLKEDWQHIQANVLMAFIFEATNRPGLSRKHFAIAKVRRMREIGGYLQPKNNDPKNFRRQGIQFQVEIIDYKTVVTKDQSMKPDDCDQIFFELIDLLLQTNLYKAADICL